MLSQPFQDAIRQRLSIPVHEGPDKTTTLEQALRQHVPAGLLAGGMGVPFPPSRWLRGSTMEEDNARSGDLIAADDPFGAGGRVAYVRALVPDVALLHGWVADRAGNVITASPMNENTYGAMAARGGAVVTVEKIVSTDFIRRHADLVRLPSQYVPAVVETPH